jgi:hypothetical protein
MSVEDQRVTCPACGGAGGGPFGRAGGAWDDEEYVCPKCAGRGWLAQDELVPISNRPGIVKAQPDDAPSQQTKKKASA